MTKPSLENILTTHFAWISFDVFCMPNQLFLSVLISTVIPHSVLLHSLCSHSSACRHIQNFSVSHKGGSFRNRILHEAVWWTSSCTVYNKQWRKYFLSTWLKIGRTFGEKCFRVLTCTLQRTVQLSILTKLRISPDFSRGIYRLVTMKVLWRQAISPMQQT